MMPFSHVDVIPNGWITMVDGYVDVTTSLFRGIDSVNKSILTRSHAIIIEVKVLTECKAISEERYIIHVKYLVLC